MAISKEEEQHASIVERDVEKGQSDTVSQCATDNRALQSLRKGDSEVEILATRIEKRQADRIPVTSKVRVTFLKTCRKIAHREGCPRSMIPVSSLQKLHEDVKAQVDARQQADSHMRKFFSYLGFLDEKATLLEVLDRALERIRETKDSFFHYQDFNFYNTRLVSRWPWMRHSLIISCLLLLLFYILTPVWFCYLVPDEQVCPADPDPDRVGGPRWYYGWLTALYFASTTMSTVGYGDVTVQKDTRGYAFVGIAYMMIALLVAVTAFSAAADSAFSRFGGLGERCLSVLFGDLLDGKLLHQKMRKIKIIKLLDVALQFTLLNVIGMFLARFFVKDYVSDPEWTWMTTMYWAVQTTTTIGYGDLDMPFEFRWFQILYLTVGTYFVGGALGKLASLKQEIEATKRFYAWQRRTVSKGMIMDMNLNDDVVDQYEFVVSTLLSLRKITSDDIGPIMDRFRTLAGEKGYIQVSDQTSDDEFDMKEDGDGVRLSFSSMGSNEQNGPWVA